MSDMLVKLYDLPEVAPLVKRLAEQGVVLRNAMPPEKHLVVDLVPQPFSEVWAT